MLAHFWKVTHLLRQIQRTSETWETPPDFEVHNLKAELCNWTSKKSIISKAQVPSERWSRRMYIGWHCCPLFLHHILPPLLWLMPRVLSHSRLRCVPPQSPTKVHLAWTCSEANQILPFNESHCPVFQSLQAILFSGWKITWKIHSWLIDLKVIMDAGSYLILNASWENIKVSGNL